LTRITAGKARVLTFEFVYVIQVKYSSRKARRCSRKHKLRGSGRRRK